MNCEPSRDEGNESLNEQLVELIENRLAKGGKTYGSDVMLIDPRDFVVEALEEALDLSVYLSAQLLRIKKLDPSTNFLDNIGEEQ